jgi:tetratricopeptide (TPR) repeat protein
MSVDDPFAIYRVKIEHTRKGSAAYHALYAGHLVLKNADASIAPRSPRRRPGVSKMDAMICAIADVESLRLRQSLTVMDYGERLHKAGDFDLAIVVYSRIMDCGETFPGFDFGAARYRFAYCLREAGDFEAAERELQAGMAWASRYGDHHAMLNLKIALASLACARGMLSVAESSLDAALDGAEAIQDQRLISRAALERANVAIARGNLPLAQQLHERALRATALRLQSGDRTAQRRRAALSTTSGSRSIARGFASTPAKHFGRYC